MEYAFRQCLPAGQLLRLSALTFCATRLLAALRCAFLLLFRARDRSLLLLLLGAIDLTVTHIFPYTDNYFALRRFGLGFRLGVGLGFFLSIAWLGTLGISANTLFASTYWVDTGSIRA